MYNLRLLKVYMPYLLVVNLSLLIDNPPQRGDLVALCKALKFLAQVE